MHIDIFRRKLDMHHEVCDDAIIFRRALNGTAPRHLTPCIICSSQPFRKIYGLYFQLHGIQPRSRDMRKNIPLALKG